MPRVNSILKTNWSRGDWSLGARVNYTSGTKLASSEFDNADYQASGCVARGVPADQCRVASWTSTDLWLQYTGLKNWTISGNLFNAFNEQSAIYYRPNTGVPYLDGRVLKLSAEVKF